MNLLHIVCRKDIKTRRRGERRAATGQEDEVVRLEARRMFAGGRKQWRLTFGETEEGDGRDEVRSAPAGG